MSAVARLAERLRPVPRLALATPTGRPEPATVACPSVLVHTCGPAKIRLACTLAAPHDGQLHEHRPRPGRMSVAEWS